MKKRIMSCIMALIFAIAGVIVANAENERVNVIFIGNSITQGCLLEHPETEGPCARSIVRIKKESGENVCWANCGVSGATTVDFLPATGTLFNRVTSAADTLYAAGGKTVFTISLGTNDSACTGTLGAPVLPQQYQTNLKVIIDTLLDRYPGAVAVVQYPLWYSPTTYNGSMYLLAGLNRLKSYFPRIDALVEEYSSARPGYVSAGDPTAFDVFSKHQEWFVEENGNAGKFYLHPNATGADKLGEVWTAPILKAIGSAPVKDDRADKKGGKKGRKVKR